MKKLLVLLPALMIFAGCAGTPTMQTRYALDSSGNLQQQQYYVPSNEDKYWKTAAIVGASIVGIAGLAWLIDEWRTPDPVAVQSQSPLIPSNGFSTTTTTSEFDNTFITPGYVTVN